MTDMITVTGMITKEELGLRLANVAGKAWSEGAETITGSKNLTWTPIEYVSKAILDELDKIVVENSDVIVFKDCVLTNTPGYDTH